MESKSSKNDANLEGHQADVKMVEMPSYGVLRLSQVLFIIGLGETAWREGVKDGFYPQPFLIGKRAVGWAAEDIRQLVQDLREGKVFRPRQ